MVGDSNIASMMGSESENIQVRGYTALARTSRFLSLTIHQSSCWLDENTFWGFQWVSWHAYSH